MEVCLKSEWDLIHEIRDGADLGSALYHSENVTADLAELVEEAHMRAVLSGRFSVEMDRLEVEIIPHFSSKPMLESIELGLCARIHGDTVQYSQKFKSGRWDRTAQLTASKLREEGTLDEGQIAQRMLLALKRRSSIGVEVPPLEPPPIIDQELEECGVRKLGGGNIVPDRPVLVNKRLAEDAVNKCVAAGASETGGAVLGKIVRLAEPLPGTETNIVTLLSATVEDPRHIGKPLSFTFSPDGLAAADQMASLRGLGESVQTVFHTHGWSNECARCNENPDCPLTECKPSHQDYQLLESLLPSKATLMPIAGRKLGAEGRRPVLEIHAWRGGQMRPIRWREYSD